MYMLDKSFKFCQYKVKNFVKKQNISENNGGNKIALKCLLIFFKFSINDVIFRPIATASFTDLDRGSKNIIFESILYRFYSKCLFRDCWSSSKNRLQLEIKPLLANLACLNW